jgi:two-component system OmpR family sensor kinase
VSFRGRLALWYGGTAGALVTLACVYSYALHGRTHYDDLDAMLESAAGHVAEELEAASTPKERLSILRASERLETRARIYSATGELEAQTGPASRVPLIDPRAVLAGKSPEPYGIAASLVRGHTGPPAGGGAFGLAQDGYGQGRWRVHVIPLSGSTEYLSTAMPLARLDASIRSFGRLMLAMALVGSAAAFLVGWIVAGRATRPIAVLTETAGAIARSREFSRRVPVDPARDELGRLAITVNEMLSSLEQAYATQQRFIADASHELRAPLTLIQANLELAQRPGMAPDDRVTAVGEAYAETSRLSRLVADLLALARADAGMPIRRERVELDHLLMEVLGEARRLAGEHRLALDQLEPSIVSGDPDRLRQLLVILVDNALKYTPAGGRIALRLAREGDIAIIAVSDTGVGIPAEHLPHVFERFYRADPGRSRDPGGTGLGLSIARWVVEQHGGSIELTSRPGEGTTATVRLLVEG